MALPLNGLSLFRAPLIAGVDESRPREAELLTPFK